MARAHKHLADLQDRIGYRFKDEELMRRALTHSSAISPRNRIRNSYQRLEFLGDRVLGLVVADLLFTRSPDANEGELSRTLNSVVRKESCAAVARDLDLGEYIHLGDSEARTGGAGKDAILADVCEAVIGAIYCDGGLDKAFAFIERGFSEPLGRKGATQSDPKTALQEWAQARGLEPPEYREVERSGPDHAPVFTIGVNIVGFGEATARGSSKKVAERLAAEAFIERENIRGGRK